MTNLYFFNATVTDTSSNRYDGNKLLTYGWGEEQDGRQVPVTNLPLTCLRGGFLSFVLNDSDLICGTPTLTVRFLENGGRVYSPFSSTDTNELARGVAGTKDSTGSVWHFYDHDGNPFSIASSGPEHIFTVRIADETNTNWRVDPQMNVKEPDLGVAATFKATATR